MSAALNRGRGFVAAAAALWGCWSIVFKNAERHAGAAGLSPLIETAVVVTVVLFALTPFAVRVRRRRMGAAPRSRALWGSLFALGIGDALTTLCFFAAMQYTTVALAVLTHYLAPLFVAIGAPLFVGERWRGRTFVALFVAFFGLVLLLRPWVQISSKDAVGAALGAASALFYAANVFIGKRCIEHFDAWEVAAWPKFSSLLLLAAAALFAGDLHLTWASAGILVVGTIICGVFPTMLYYRGLAVVPASQASVLTLAEPLVAVIVGVVVWGESLSWLGFLGAAAVLAGAALIVAPER